MQPVAELEEPEPWRSPVPFLWLAIAVLVSGAVAALLSGAADPPADEGDARARIVAAAGTATAVDFAYTMEFDFDFGPELAVPPAPILEGRYDAETRRTHTRAGQATLGMEMITDGSVLYVRWEGMGPRFSDATGGKPWGRREMTSGSAEGNELGMPFAENPIDQLTALGRLTGPVVRVGDEDVRGVSTAHYWTTAEMEAEEDARIDVWLDDSDRVRRVRHAFEVEGRPFSFAFEVFDVGKPVTIEVPPADLVGPFDPKDLFPVRPS